MTDQADRVRKLIALAFDRSTTVEERFAAWNRCHRLAYKTCLTGDDFLELLQVTPAQSFLRGGPAPPEECVHGLRFPWGRYVGELYTEVVAKDRNYVEWAVEKLPDVHREAAEEALQ